MYETAILMEPDYLAADAQNYFMGSSYQQLSGVCDFIDF